MIFNLLSEPLLICNTSLESPGIRLFGLVTKVRHDIG